MCRRIRIRSGFTLIEILMVIAIVLLVTVIAVPVIWSSINGRQSTDAARIFTGALVGARDAAVKFTEPRGIRLLPDPDLTIPAPGQPNAGTLQLVYTRMIPIQPGDDISDGRVNIGPVPLSTPTFPPAYPNVMGGVYPFPSTLPATLGQVQVLMVEEAPYQGGYVTPNGLPNSPTNWMWNVRLGDKIKIGGTGRAYTVVGPCTINPWTSNQNSELFVNVGPPGSTSPLDRTCYRPNSSVFARYSPEFLFLVNGQDDDGDGWIDEGWDGANQNPPQSGPRAPGLPPYPPGPYDGVNDNLIEWEDETWVGAYPPFLVDTAQAPGLSPSIGWATATAQRNIVDSPYAIQRRPTPSPGARAIALPGGTVIDATTWNSTQERSRIPVEQGSLYADIMINTNGLYIPTTAYSAPSSAPSLPFLHFWLTEKTDVYPDGTLWGTGATGPNVNPTAGQSFRLPMSGDALGVDPSGFIVSGGFYPPATSPTFPILKGDRRLVTLFTQSGLIVVNPLDSVPPAPVGTSPVYTVPGEGFHVNDVNYPFYKAQSGQRAAR